jgi:nucleotide-binding universal stress UspA family protein
MSICLAYDGSVNGDWVARHAVRLAAGEASQRLRIVHVETAEIAAARLAGKFDNIRLIAARAGVEVDVEICAMKEGVVGGLVEHLAGDPDVLVIAGVRAQGGRRGFLADTVSWQLLKDTTFDVVAYRVVQPGTLGVVRRLLLPLAGHSAGHRAAARMLGLLAHDLRTARLLNIVELPAQRLRGLTAPEAAALRHRATAFLEGIESGLGEVPALEGLRLEAAARISDDWSREVIIDAAQQKSDLIALEASRQSLERGFRYGDPFESLLRDAPCDVAIYRSGANHGG